jgi:hypothetical protein
MSGFADQIFGYFAIVQQMSGFADRIFGYFAIVLHVHVLGTRTVLAPHILISVDNGFISGYLADIWHKISEKLNIGYFQP